MPANPHGILATIINTVNSFVYGEANAPNAQPTQANLNPLSTYWAGIVSNPAAPTWLGRGRPVTGAGATNDVGTTRLPQVPQNWEDLPTQRPQFWENTAPATPPVTTPQFWQNLPQHAPQFWQNLPTGNGPPQNWENLPTGTPQFWENLPGAAAAPRAAAPLANRAGAVLPTQPNPGGTFMAYSSTTNGWSTNPHDIPVNSAMAPEDSHAPSNNNFVGIGLQPRSFR